MRNSSVWARRAACWLVPVCLCLPLMLLGQTQGRTPSLRKVYTVSGVLTGVGQNVQVEMRISRPGDGTALPNVPVNDDFTWRWENAPNHSTYVIRPYHPWYTFVPASRTVTVNGADVANVDFAGTNHHHAK